MHGDTKRIGGNARNRIQVLDRIIERSALEQGLVDVRLRSAEEDGVAIRAGARDGSGTKRGAAAADVFNHDRPDQRLHFVRPWTADKIERPTRRKWHHKANWLGRV